MGNEATTPDLAVRLNGHEACEEFVIETNDTRHLLFVIPGTTDPINLNESTLNHASKHYWDQPFLDGLSAFAENYSFGKKDIVHLTWTGDNQVDARQKAARDLLTMVMIKTYSERTRTGKRVNLHFICHSHGGNIINEFTHYAMKDSDFPDTIKVRSIVYLSTPFFRKQAQINTDILHPHCRIVNAYNKYDLTQRFVANFSMHQMPALLTKFENDKGLKQAIQSIKNAPYVGMIKLLLGNSIAMEGSYMGNKTSRPLWIQIHGIFSNINNIISNIDDILIKTHDEHPKFITNSILDDISGGILSSLKNSLSNPLNNLSTNVASNKHFSLASLFDAIGDGVADFVNNLNRFLKFYSQDEFNQSGLRSPLSDVIGNILMNQMQAFDDTEYNPEPQFKGLIKVIHIDVTQHDPYDKLPESSNYDKFINRLEALEDDYRLSDEYGPDGANVRAEIVFTLAAQEDYGIFLLLDTLLKWMNELTDGQIQTLIQQTRKTISIYAREMKKRDYKILHHPPTETMNVYRFLPFEKEIEEGIRSINHIKERVLSTPFSTAKGGIPYLAVKSHSVSRRTFLTDVKLHWQPAMPDKQYAPMYTIKKKNC